MGLPPIVPGRCPGLKESGPSGLNPVRRPEGPLSLSPGHRPGNWVRPAHPEPGWGVPVTPTDDLFAEAVTRHQAGDGAAAEEIYRKILAVDPQHPGALTNLGVILARSGNLDEAARLY